MSDYYYRGYIYCYYMFLKGIIDIIKGMVFYEVVGIVNKNI